MLFSAGFMGLRRAYSASVGGGSFGPVDMDCRFSEGVGIRVERDPGLASNVLPTDLARSRKCHALGNEVGAEVLIGRGLRPVVGVDRMQVDLIAFRGVEVRDAVRGVS